MNNLPTLFLQYKPTSNNSPQSSGLGYRPRRGILGSIFQGMRSTIGGIGVPQRERVAP